MAGDDGLGGVPDSLALPTVVEGEVTGVIQGASAEQPQLDHARDGLEAGLSADPVANSPNLRRRPARHFIGTTSESPHTVPKRPNAAESLEHHDVGAETGYPHIPGRVVIGSDGEPGPTSPFSEV